MWGRPRNLGWMLEIVWHPGIPMLSPNKSCQDLAVPHKNHIRGLYIPDPASDFTAHGLNSALLNIHAP